MQSQCLQHKNGAQTTIITDFSGTNTLVDVIRTCWSDPNTYSNKAYHRTEYENKCVGLTAGGREAK